MKTFAYLGAAAIPTTVVPTNVQPH